MQSIYLIYIYIFFHFYTQDLKQVSFSPALLQFGRLPLNRRLHVTVCVCQCVCLAFQLLLFLPLLPAVDLPQLLQGIVGYRKKQR